MIGNGKNLHHLIYVDDLIEGFFLASTVEAAIGQTFVLAGKDPLTTEDMVTTIAEELGTKISPFRAPLSLFLITATIMESVLRPLGIQPPLHRRRMDFFKKSFVFSPTLSSQLLGFAPRYTFKQGVAETAKWYTDTGVL
jgi:nucleoside-diphosphate-sugar epimerase